MITIFPRRRPAAAAAVAAPPRLDLRFLLYFYLHMAGFVATTLLITWGLLVLLFLAVGGFSLDGLMNQLNNLTTRYVQADAARVASFKATLLTGQLLLAAAVIFFRRHRLLPARLDQRSPTHG